MRKEIILIFIWLVVLTIFTFWSALENIRLHDLNRGVWQAQIEFNQHIESLLDKPQN